MFEYDKICEFEKPYIIAEIGSNHNGDMNLAKKMIDEAKRCGADCVKFQSWSKDTIFSEKVYQDNYFLKDDYRNRTDYTLKEIVDEYSINREDHYLLNEYCKKVGIDFNSTPCLQKNGCQKIILLHCVSIYPPADDMVNLNNIDMLRNTFGCKVGYSDHTIGTVAPLLAMAKGVCIIEKHFTLDKSMVGWDHKVSANPEELKVICNAAKVGYKMLGSYQKIVNEDEERRNAFKRSIVAARKIKCGEIITEDDIDFKRPGTGIEPKYYSFIVGRRATRDIQKDCILSREDF